MHRFLRDFILLERKKTRDTDYPEKDFIKPVYFFIRYPHKRGRPEVNLDFPNQLW